MEDDPQKQANGRTGNGRFAKGTSGNPGGGGRPRGPSLTTLLIREAEKRHGKSRKTKGQWIAERAVQLAIDGELKAIEFVYNRIDGKVPQAIQVRDERERPKPLVYPSSDDRFAATGLHREPED